MQYLNVKVRGSPEQDISSLHAFGPGALFAYRRVRFCGFLIPPSPTPPLLVGGFAPPTPPHKRHWRLRRMAHLGFGRGVGAGWGI